MSIGSESVVKKDRDLSIKEITEMIDGLIKQLIRQIKTLPLHSRPSIADTENFVKLIAIDERVEELKFLRKAINMKVIQEIE